MEVTLVWSPSSEAPVFFGSGFSGVVPFYQKILVYFLFIGPCLFLDVSAFARVFVLFLAWGGVIGGAGGVTYIYIYILFSGCAPG